MISMGIQLVEANDGLSLHIGSWADMAAIEVSRDCRVKRPLVKWWMARSNFGVNCYLFLWGNISDIWNRRISLLQGKQTRT